MKDTALYTALRRKKYEKRILEEYKKILKAVKRRRLENKKYYKKILEMQQTILEKQKNANEVKN